MAVSLSAAELEPLIQEERARCTELGIQLGISYPRLEEIEKDSKAKKPVSECFSKMCRAWLIEEEKERKWSEVFKALRQQKNNRLEASLKKTYREDETSNNSYM